MRLSPMRALFYFSACLLLSQCGGGGAAEALQSLIPEELPDTGNDSDNETVDDGSTGEVLDLSGFSHRLKVTFDNSDQATDLVSFPVLVRISAASPIHSNIVSATGDDVRFVDPSTGNSLYFEKESYDNSGSSDSIYWVRVPKISASLNTEFIYMYYGKNGLSSASNGSKTFPAEIYKRVYHFNDNFAGAIGELASDSTGQGTISTIIGSDITSSAGLIGNGFNGASKDAGFDSNLTSQTMRQGTVSLLIKMNSNYSSWRRIMSNETGNELSLSIASNTSGARMQLKVSYDGGTNNEWRSTNSVSTNGSTWNHLAYAWDFTSGVNMAPNLYLDGDKEVFSMGSPISGTMDTTSEAYSFYCRKTTNDRMPTGDHDELRIYQYEMPEDWIKAEHKNYTGVFLSLGVEEAL